ncbi:MAG: hypothetical protein WCA35_25635 [Kovacikia sp.]
MRIAVGITSNLRYIEKYAKKTTLPEKNTAQFLDSLRGKIEFVGSVRGKDDYLYQKLLAKFNDLRNTEANRQKSTENQHP